MNITTMGGLVALLLVTVVAFASGERTRMRIDRHQSENEKFSRGPGLAGSRPSSRQRPGPSAKVLVARAAAVGRAARRGARALNPVVLIPGIGGTQLEQTWSNVTGPHIFCSSNSPLWERTW